MNDEKIIAMIFKWAMYWAENEMAGFTPCEAETLETLKELYEEYKEYM